MPHTEIVGNNLITIVLDDVGDYITPVNFKIDRVYWLPVRNTDRIILREFIPDRGKSSMPYLPLLGAIQTTGIIHPEVSTRFLVDYEASTTPAGNTIVFLGQWLR